MNRVGLVLVVIASLLVGGVVMEHGSSQANPDPQRRDPWAQPPPPVPPVPPRAPRPPRVGGGVSISIRGNKIHIDGLDQLVAGHLQAVRELLRNNPNLPKDVRDKITARMDRVKAIVDKHLARLSTTDLDKLDDQLEKMGDELEKAMAGLDADLAQLGKLGNNVAKDLTKNLGKDLVKGFAKKSFKFDFDNNNDDNDDDNDDDVDHDDDNDSDSDDLSQADDSDVDHDVQAAMDDLKSFSLKPAQKDAIAKLRATSDAQVAAAKQQLEAASRRLEAALADVKISDADIARYVDQVTAHEASIRKARLLAWVAARRVLDADQVTKLEAAVAKTR